MCPFFPTTILYVMHLKALWEICLDFGPPQSISSGAQLWKCFSQSKFCYVLFCKPPTNKTETGTANTWGITNNKPPGPIIMIRNTEQQLDHNFHYTLFFCMCTVLLLLSAIAQRAIMLSQIQFPEPNWQNVGWYSSPNFTLLCTITYRAPLEMMRCNKIVACNFGTPTQV